MKSSFEYVQEAIAMLVNYPELESEYPDYYRNDTLDKTARVRYENYCCFLWNVIVAFLDELESSSDKSVEINRDVVKMGFAVYELVEPHFKWFTDEFTKSDIEGGRVQEVVMECIEFKKEIEKENKDNG